MATIVCSEGNATGRFQLAIIDVVTIGVSIAGSVGALRQPML